MQAQSRDTALENSWRDAFPVLRADPGLVYLDTAASALKPEAVIAAMS